MDRLHIALFSVCFCAVVSFYSSVGSGEEPDPAPKLDPIADAADVAPGSQASEKCEEEALAVLKLLDIPEGESLEFYETRRDELKSAMRKYVGKTPDREAYDAVVQKVEEAYSELNRRIVESPEFDKSASTNNFTLYCDSLVKKGALEEIETLLAQERAKAKPDASRVYALQAASIGASIASAARKKDGAFLRKIGDALVEKSCSEPTNESLQLFVYGMAHLERADKEIAASAKRKAQDRFFASGNKTLKEFATTYEAVRRKADCVGSELRVEGVFLDGSTIDWKSYRGKVVLIDVWATWCGPCRAELPNVQALYAKYHDDGFEVIGYSIDSDVEELKNFAASQKLPWKTASQAASVGKYVDFAKYYAVSTVPTMILVGRDGKVVDADARGTKLQELLKAQFGR